RHDYLFGRVDGSGGGVFADSRDEDAGAAGAAAVRDGFDCCAISGEASEGGAGALSGPRFASGSFVGAAADEGIRGDDGFRFEGRVGGGAAFLRSDAG